MESKEHEAAKKRIRDIARRRDHIAENEVRFICWSGYHERAISYYADIFVGSNRKATAIIVEIDGYKGHSSKYQTIRDTRRTEDIKNTWGDHIDVRRFTIEELEETTDEEIEKQLGIE